MIAFPNAGRSSQCCSPGTKPRGTVSRASSGSSILFLPLLRSNTFCSRTQVHRQSWSPPWLMPRAFLRRTYECFQRQHAGSEDASLNLTGGPEWNQKQERKCTHKHTHSALWLLAWGHSAPPHPHHDGGANLLIPWVRWKQSSLNSFLKNSHADKSLVQFFPYFLPSTSCPYFLTFGEKRFLKSSLP